MNASVEDLRPTIVPKSDQLNAEQLLGGPMTVTVSRVDVSNSPEQPVTVHYEGEQGRPFKPCKTMRKLLVHAWGADGREWSGRAMTLYNDPAVKFGGEDVGGIRISHLSHIESRIKVSLTATRGKKTLYQVDKLEDEDAGRLADIQQSPTIDALKDNFGAAWKSTKGDARRAMLKQAYDKRLAELNTPSTNSAPAKTFDEFKAEVSAATSAEIAGLVLDAARDVLTDDENEQLADAYRAAWSN